MRLNCIKTKAKYVVVDTFIYMPEKMAFFFVDDIVHDGDMVTFIFEEGIDEEDGGFINEELIYPENEEVLVVCDYSVNKKELLEEMQEQEKLNEQ